MSFSGIEFSLFDSFVYVCYLNLCGFSYELFLLLNRHPSFVVFVRYTTVVMFQFPVLGVGAAVIVLSTTVAAAYLPSPPFPSVGISCLDVGSTATAQWVNAAGQSCTWTGVVGSNFGISPLNGREYVDGSTIDLLFCFVFGRRPLLTRIHLILLAMVASDGM